MFLESLDPVFQRLQKGGVFLTAGKVKPNTMTIGWGGPQIYWGKQIFIAPVRPSRFTYSLLETDDEFTVSVPAPGDASLNKALALCGSKSGRDTDKYVLAGINPVKGQVVDVPVIDGCQFYFECKIIYRQDLIGAQLPQTVLNGSYPNQDFHRLYFGEVIACYKK